jgi:hypothetical protein
MGDLIIKSNRPRFGHRCKEGSRPLAAKESGLTAKCCRIALMRRPQKRRGEPDGDKTPVNHRSDIGLYELTMADRAKWMIYGANGYTGHHAVALGKTHQASLVTNEPLVDVVELLDQCVDSRSIQP